MLAGRFRLVPLDLALDLLQRVQVTATVMPTAGRYARVSSGLLSHHYQNCKRATESYAVLQLFEDGNMCAGSNADRERFPRPHLETRAISGIVLQILPMIVSLSPQTDGG